MEMPYYDVDLVKCVYAHERNSSDSDFRRLDAFIPMQKELEHAIQLSPWFQACSHP